MASTNDVQIRMRISIEGLFHNLTDVQRGDLVPVDAANAASYFRAGIAVPADVKELGEPCVA
jgi:hypothetical protein